MSLCSRRWVPMTISTEPAAKSRDHSRLFAAAAKAREQFDAHRVIGHAFAERVEMLLGQHRGRNEHGDLFAAQRGLERRPEWPLPFCRSQRPRKSGGPWVWRLPCPFWWPRWRAPGRAFPRRESCSRIPAATTCPAGKGVPLLRRSGPPGWPACRPRCRARPRSACALVLAQRVPLNVLQRRTHLAGADVFADQMRLAHRHVKFRRRAGRLRRRVFDHQAFLAGPTRRRVRESGAPAMGMTSTRDNGQCRVANAPRNRPPPVPQN